MWLTRVFLLRPTLGFVIVVLTLIAGYMALRNLVVQEQPNTGLPTITITPPSRARRRRSADGNRPADRRPPCRPALFGEHSDDDREWFGFNRGDLFRSKSTTTEDIANVESGLQAAAHDLRRRCSRPCAFPTRTSQPSSTLATHFEEIRRRLPRCGCRKYNRSRDRATPGRLHG